MRPSQPQKSPTTLTRRAFGAQTAKLTPATPSIVADVRAELLPEPPVRSLVEEVQVDVAERRQEAVRVVALPGRAVGEMEAKAIRERERRARRRTPQYIFAKPETVTSSGMTRPSSSTASTAVALGIRARMTTPFTPLAAMACAPRMSCGCGYSPASRRPRSFALGSRSAADGPVGAGRGRGFDERDGVAGSRVMSLSPWVAARPADRAAWGG